MQTSDVGYRGFRVILRFFDGLIGVSMVAGFVPTAESTSVATFTLKNCYMNGLTACGFNGDGLMSADIDGLLDDRCALGFRRAALFAGIAVGTARIETALSACQ